MIRRRVKGVTVRVRFKTEFMKIVVTTRITSDHRARGGGFSDSYVGGKNVSGILRIGPVLFFSRDLALHYVFLLVLVFDRTVPFVNTRLERSRSLFLVVHYMPPNQLEMQV